MPDFKIGHGFKTDFNKTLEDAASKGLYGGEPSLSQMPRWSERPGLNLLRSYWANLANDEKLMELVDILMPGPSKVAAPAAKVGGGLLKSLSTLPFFAGMVKKNFRLLDILESGHKNIRSLYRQMNKQSWAKQDVARIEAAIAKAKDASWIPPINKAGYPRQPGVRSYYSDLPQGTSPEPVTKTPIRIKPGVWEEHKIRPKPSGTAKIVESFLENFPQIEPKLGSGGVKAPYFGPEKKRVPFDQWLKKERMQIKKKRAAGDLGGLHIKTKTPEAIGRKLAEQLKTVRFEGIQQGLIDAGIPDMALFTALKGPAKGTTFSVEKLTMEALRKKLQQKAKAFTKINK